MVGDRVEHFEGKGTDLSALQSHVEGYQKGNGFTVQASAPSAQGTVIQARKGGFLAGFIRRRPRADDRDPRKSRRLYGRVGIGKWIEHIATAAIETLLV